MATIVKINGETAQIGLEGIENLSALVEKVASERFGPKEIINEIYVNDRALADDEIQAAAAWPLASISTVNLVTIKNPAEQVGELLEKMEEYLDKLAGGLTSIAGRFRAGAAEEANQTLFHAIEGLRTFVELLDSVRIVTKSDLAGVQEGGASFTQSEERLLDVTRAMRESQEARDWVTVADILEYELAPLILDWRRMTPKIKDEVRKSL